MIISVFGLVSISFGTVISFADTSTPGVYSVESKPFGKSYGESAASWWQWFSGIRSNQNPGIDNSGAFCNVGQPNKDVWFLTLTFGTANQVSRSCTIPAGRSKFVPIFSNDCDTSEYPAYTTRDQFASSARQQTDSVSTVLSLTLDGKPIGSLESYRTDSPMFNITYPGPTPKDNVYSVKPGVYPGVVDGFFVMLKPLPVGKHDLHIKHLLLTLLKRHQLVAMGMIFYITSQ